MEKNLKGIPVLFENSFCLVLNKPSGLSVQGGEGVKTSLDSILSELVEPRPFLVHRLDRDTSGLILAAKTREAAAAFSALFSGGARSLSDKGRALIKRYLGVCSGIPVPDSGLIDLELDIRGKRKKSETSYKCQKSGTACGVSLSLLELELGTGRMHQIRRHLARSGHPLLGDDKYGDFSLNKKFRKTAGLKTLLLHASRLVIPPAPGLIPEGLDISAALPGHFTSFLELLTYSK